MAVLASEKKFLFATISGTAAMVFFFIIVFVGAPIELGHGYVPMVAKEFMNRLDSGTAYQTISSVKDKGTVVLLIRKTGTSEFLAIRIKEVAPIPEHFTLIDGKPVAIVPPTPTVDSSHPLDDKK